MYLVFEEFPKGWGVKKIPQKWKIPGGWGSYVKFPPWWGYGYFLELHNRIYHFCMVYDYAGKLTFERAVGIHFKEE